MYPRGDKGVDLIVWTGGDRPGHDHRGRSPAVDLQRRCLVFNDDASGDLHLLPAPESERVRSYLRFRLGVGASNSGRRTADPTSRAAAAAVGQVSRGRSPAAPVPVSHRHHVHHDGDDHTGVTLRCLAVREEAAEKSAR